MTADEGRFGIAAGNTLRQIDFKSKRGGQYESWEFEEIDPEGNVVARCSKWIRSDFFGKVESEGWKKVDLNGVVIAEGDNLD